MAPTSETYDQWLAKQKSPKFESKVSQNKTNVPKNLVKNTTQEISREGTKRKKRSEKGVA